MRFKFLTGLFTLSPLLVFFSIFLESRVYLSIQGQENAFYQISASIAILPAIIFAVCIAREPLQKTIDLFLEGVRDINIIIMCLVFLLAGALASILQEIGSVESTVNFALNFISAQAILPAIFLISALISTARVPQWERLRQLPLLG
jgi:Na+/H+ antiporter NhaC